MNLESDNPDDYGPSGLQECVGRDVSPSTAVDVQTSANEAHTTAAAQTEVRQAMTFAQVAMTGLGRSADDYRYSRALPSRVQ